MSSVGKMETRKKEEKHEKMEQQLHRKTMKVNE